MTAVFEYPLDGLIAVVLLQLSLCAFFRNGALFRRAFRDPEHPRQSEWVIRGFRTGIIGLSLISVAGGVYFHATWPIVVGAVFLGEELFETGIMLLAIRLGRARA